MLPRVRRRPGNAAKSAAADDAAERPGMQDRVQRSDRCGPADDRSMLQGERLDGKSGEEAPMVRWPTICRCCLGDGVPRRSAAVALVVGTILNLINQGDALLAGLPLSPMKLVLTYLVPYGVATYGAVSYRLATGKPTA
jgi:hypothetical protein